jgi:hypothetical protein
MSLKARTITEYVKHIGSLFLHRGWFTRALLESPKEPLQSKYR